MHASTWLNINVLFFVLTVSEVICTLFNCPLQLHVSPHLHHNNLKLHSRTAYAQVFPHRCRVMQISLWWYNRGASSHSQSMVNSLIGYILLSAPIYAEAKGQIRPLQSKQKILLSSLVNTKRKTCTKNLCYELNSDQQNANVQLIQCVYAAFPYQTLGSILALSVECMWAYVH